jgi:hypothetical protein
MSHSTPIRNPFMLMLHPEVVLAAVERSERLGQLNRHLCRPLDRQAGPGSRTTTDDADDDEVGEDSAN